MMATDSLVMPYTEVPFWMSNDSITFKDSEELTYTTSERSTTSNSLSSPADDAADSPERPHIFNPFLYTAEQVQSPEESRYGCQLPSPLEDELLLDPALMDKARRREQNRVAQRAFRERKESKLKQLEKKITELRSDQRQLERKYQNLRTAHLRLQSGLKVLLDGSGTFDDLSLEPFTLSESKHE